MSDSQINTSFEVWTFLMSGILVWFGYIDLEYSLPSEWIFYWFCFSFSYVS